MSKYKKCNELFKDYIAQLALNSQDAPASASQVLGFQVCTTVASWYTANKYILLFLN